MKPLLEIKNLRTYLDTAEGTLKAVNDVSLTIPKGKVVALVGESGCGKSMTALSILRLIPVPPAKIVGGEILFYDNTDSPVNLLRIPEKELRKIRGNRIAMIFQEPMTSLNPVFTVGDQIGEAVMLHQKLSKKEARAKTIDMLKLVGIPNPSTRIDDYPHQLSGGMRQRVMIAMALSCNPTFLIADEPTTALDVTIQAQILELMEELIKKTKMSLLLITHDLGIVAEKASHVCVMYAGKIIEEGSVEEIFDNPKHPYTRGLMDSIPSLQAKGEKRLKAIPGNVPSLAKLPKGCAFQERCSRALDDCRLNEPGFFGNGHRYRCFHPIN
ncbi:MAG TPA: peptide ABC transporter ATP-binding protein [Deltaproteobacteria bacterium]|nr:MAG: peptide ABC transporter ATP-binding protein [Deltaproteobacteria bacterium GWA2_45_12]HBF13832.1 peptide ABC transporter ATP-binding protein [Deltaproteobacteria bacterium]